MELHYLDAKSNVQQTPKWSKTCLLTKNTRTHFSAPLMKRLPPHPGYETALLNLNYILVNVYHVTFRLLILNFFERVVRIKKVKKSEEEKKKEKEKEEQRSKEKEESDSKKTKKKQKKEEGKKVSCDLHGIVSTQCRLS